jgi:hypothetical protein
MWYGERLEEHLIAKAGEFVYIPAGMPHLPYNLSATESCVAVIAARIQMSRRALSCCLDSMASIRRFRPKLAHRRLVQPPLSQIKERRRLVLRGSSK